MTEKGSGLWAWARVLFIANLPESDLAALPFPFLPSVRCFPINNKVIRDSISSRTFSVAPAAIGGGGGEAEMVAVAAEGPIRSADAVQAAAAVEAARAADATKGGDAPAAKEEVKEYASDMRKLEELFSKLNPSAAEFVPLSRRRGDGRQLSADAPVFVSPAIDYYARHPQVLPQLQLQPQPQPMHVLQLVGAGPGGGMGGGGGMDSSSDGSANGQPNRRVIAELPSPIRCGLSQGRGLQWDSCGWIDWSVSGLSDVDGYTFFFLTVERVIGSLS